MPAVGRALVLFDEAVFVYVPYRMPSPWMNEKWVKGGFEYE
jgi:hypothetical protein